MLLENHIVAGSLKIHKSVFTIEMLKAESCLRTLLNWKTADDCREGHPIVSKPDNNGIITIDFNSIHYINIGDQLEKLLNSLKAQYLGKIRGKVTCMGIYRNMFTF